MKNGTPLYIHAFLCHHIRDLQTYKIVRYLAYPVFEAIRLIGMINYVVSTDHCYCLLVFV